MKTRDVRGEGFSVRFMKRPYFGKKTEEALEEQPVAAPVPEQQRQEPAMTSSKMDEANLWTAARTGDCYTIRMLVMKGVDLEARDLDGRTAINLATQYNQHDALKTLLAGREMKRMAAMGDLPDSGFFRKFNAKTATNKS